MRRNVLLLVLGLACWFLCTWVANAGGQDSEASWRPCGVQWLGNEERLNYRKALFEVFGIEPANSFVIVLVVPHEEPEWALTLGLTDEGYWTLSQMEAVSNLWWAGRRSPSESTVAGQGVRRSGRRIRERPEAFAVWEAFRREMLRVRFEENLGLALHLTQVELYVSLVGAPRACAEREVPGGLLPEGPLGKLLHGMLRYIHGDEAKREELAAAIMELAERVP